MPDYHPGLAEIVKYLIAHKTEWDFVLFREITPGHYELVMEFDTLSMVSDRLPKKSAGRAFGQELTSRRRFPMCQRCGCRYYTTRASEFKAVDGMVSKVRECPFCYALSIKYAIATSEVCIAEGTPAAIEYQVQNMMKRSIPNENHSD